MLEPKIVYIIVFFKTKILLVKGSGTEHLVPDFGELTPHDALRPLDLDMICCSNII